MKGFGVDLDQTVYALDSTTVDLCLNLFPWAHFRRSKAAVKVHALLDLRGNIPTFIDITPGCVHDIKMLDSLILEPGAYCIMDRAYWDFARLHRLHQSAAFFVIRPRSNWKFKRLYSEPVDKNTGLICGQAVKLSEEQSRLRYPDKWRRLKYYDRETDRSLTFLTNNLCLP